MKVRLLLPLTLCILCSCGVDVRSSDSLDTSGGLYCFMIPPFTQEELEERSTFIVDAVIESKGDTLDGTTFNGYPIPYTEYAFSVLDVYKGDCSSLSSAYFCGDTTTEKRSSYNDERLVIGKKYKLYLQLKGEYVVSTIPSTYILLE